MLSIKSVLCPTDFSPQSQSATQAALNIARLMGAKLMLLHVIDDPVIYFPMMESYPLPTREQLETYAEERLENWIPDSDRGDLQIQHFWIHGQPAEEIVKFASKSKADMIVMATHGRRGVPRFLLGSVSENVCRYASCPVLLHRAKNNPARPHQ